MPATKRLIPATRCMVFRRVDGTWIFPMVSIGGPMTTSEPVQVVAAGASDTEVGTAVFAALNDAAALMTKPVAKGNGLKSVQKLGFKSWGELQLGAQVLDVAQEGKRVRVSVSGEVKSGLPRTCDCEFDAEIIGRSTRELAGRAIVETLSVIHPPKRVAGIEPARDRDESDVPGPFGYKRSWLALSVADGIAVCDALGLTNVQPIGWSDGLGQSYGARGDIFVSPPVGGWTLAIGSLPSADQEEFLPLLQILSRQFGQAFYFGTHRIVDYHAWAIAEDGEILRAYGYLGESGNCLLDVGQRTSDEVDLKTGLADGPYPDEETVLKLAGRWVLDPLSIDQHTGACGPGWLGSRRQPS
jgi:hypothetical protein